MAMLVSRGHGRTPDVFPTATDGWYRSESDFRSVVSITHLRKGCVSGQAKRACRSAGGSEHAWPDGRFCSAVFESIANEALHSEAVQIVTQLVRRADRVDDPAKLGVVPHRLRVRRAGERDPLVERPQLGEQRSHLALDPLAQQEPGIADVAAELGEVL